MYFFLTNQSHSERFIHIFVGLTKGSTLSRPFFMFWTTGKVKWFWWIWRYGQGQSSDQKNITSSSDMLPLFSVTQFIIFNYLGSFVKATVGVRTEEITYILSKFMRTMFTEPLKNNRFSSSFVFGDQTIFWHFPFSRLNSILLKLLFVCATVGPGLTLKCPLIYTAYKSRIYCAKLLLDFQIYLFILWSLSIFDVRFCGDIFGLIQVLQTHFENHITRTRQKGGFSFKNKIVLKMA